MVTAKGEELDRIIGLEMGADDYLSKPFNPRELLARVRAVLRRAGAATPSAERARHLAFSGWRIDCLVRELKDPNGTRITLTSAEFGLLQVLCERAGRVLSREQLLDLTQGRSSDSLDAALTCSSAGCAARSNATRTIRGSSKPCARAAICSRRRSRRREI